MCLKYVHVHTSNKCSLKVIPIPQFTYGASSLIVLVVVHHKAQI